MTVRQATRVGSRQTTWYVQSETNPNVEYIVHNKRDAVSHRPRWTCNCPDFTERQQFVRDGVCKHIVSAQTFKASQEAAEAALKANPPVDAGFPAPTVKQVLDTLVRVLNQNNDQSRLLWQVISALRGPDSPQMDSLKFNTTATIRGALGITYSGIIRNPAKPFGSEHVCFDLLNTRISVGKTVARSFPNAQEHFTYHYAEALWALKSLGYIK